VLKAEFWWTFSARSERGGSHAGHFRFPERERRRWLRGRRVWQAGPAHQWERGGKVRELGWFPSRAGSAGLGPGCSPVGLCPSSFFFLF
jgi:hypothetical protein